MFPKSNKKIEDVNINARVIRHSKITKGKPTKPSDATTPRPPAKSKSTSWTLTARIMERKMLSPSRARCLSRKMDTTIDITTPAYSAIAVQITTAQKVTVIGAHPYVTTHIQVWPGWPWLTTIAAPDQKSAKSVVANTIAAMPRARIQSRANPTKSQISNR